MKQKQSTYSLACNIISINNGTNLINISSKVKLAKDKQIIKCIKSLIVWLQDRQTQSLDQLKSLPTSASYSGNKLTSLSIVCNRDTNNPQKSKQYKYKDIVKEDRNSNTNCINNSNILNSSSNIVCSLNENSPIISNGGLEPSFLLSPIPNTSFHPFRNNKSSSKDNQQQYPVLPNLSLFDFKA